MQEREYKIRRATLEELWQIEEMIESSRAAMVAMGNPHQWRPNYPDEETLRKDILAGNSYIIENQTNAVATFAFIEGEDDTYKEIKGSWENTKHPYATIHRLAKYQQYKGIADTCIKWCKEQCTSLRADTHKDNKLIQKLLIRNGFTHRGVIIASDGKPREAYQMSHTDALCLPLKAYIEQTIIPLYDLFDGAHQREHVRSVIANSLYFVERYNLDINMVYTIAAYHDVGLSEGREHHHRVSAARVREDRELKRWFDSQEIATIAEAVEDHRASAQHEPRSIYGKVVAEADKDIDPQRIIIRTIQYGLSHNPEASQERHWERTVAHLEEKYSAKGYVKPWLPDSPNREKLNQLQAIIANRQELRTLFDAYWRQLTYQKERRENH